MDEYPDELRVKAQDGRPDAGALGDFLREAAGWEPAVERLVNACQDRFTAARRLLKERLLTELSQIVRLVRALAAAGALRPEDLEGLDDPPGAGGATGGGQGPDPDPLGAGIPLLGRETERSRASRGSREPDGVRMVCITGPAGAGKTRLAREVVAAVSREQPASRLQVSLSRPGPGAENRQRATSPYEALAELLAQLGVPVGEIPATLEERRTRYMRELADHSPVVLLDGVVHEEHVRLLLPPRRGFVVLTSRSRLTGLNSQNVESVALGQLNPGLSRRLVQQVFRRIGVAADDRAAATIHQLSDGLPGPAVLLARWAAVTAMTEGLGPETVTERLEAVRQAGEGAAAVLGLLDDDQQAVLRALALLQLPQADLLTVILSTGLTRERAGAAIGRLALLGLAGAGEREGTWKVIPLAAKYVRAQASGTGEQDADGYERALGPVVGLYGLRARALSDLLAAVASEPAPAVKAWALRQWHAERAGLAAALEASALAPEPAMGYQLAVAYLDAAATAERDGDLRADRECVTAIVRIARHANDQPMKERALDWLETQDRLEGLSGPEPAVTEPDLPPVSGLLVPAENALPVEKALGSGQSTVLASPVLFGAGHRLP